MDKIEISTKWSASLAYVIGLITTDGSLSINGRTVDITSKDREQLENAINCLNIKNRITTKKSGSGNECLRIQISNRDFYNFLLKIGLFPKKSLTVGSVKIPKRYYFDFLRGHFDGDGTFYAYRDNRWKNSFMYYLCFTSASQTHIRWIQQKSETILGIKGHITKSKNSSVYQLKYAKKETLRLFDKMYYNNQVVCLSRKRVKIETVLYDKSYNHARVL